MNILAILYVLGSLILGYQEYLDERQFGTGKREVILRGLVVALAWPALRAYEVWKYSK